MARLARREMIDPTEIQVCHTISRCVRRAFLCGDDPVRGESYEHRRQWIRDRLEVLATALAPHMLVVLLATLSSTTTLSATEGPLSAVMLPSTCLRLSEQAILIQGCKK